MIIGVYRFLSNVNRSSVNIFITTIKISVAEASNCTTCLLWHCNIYIYTLPPKFSLKMALKSRNM